MFAPPAVAGDLLFIGSCAGTFYALDAQSGARRWTYDVKKDGKQLSFHGRILLEGKQVLFGTDHSCDPAGIGHVYAVDQATGSVVWKYRSPTGVASNLVRAGAGVCFGTVMAEWGCVTSGGLQWKSTPFPATECALPMWSATDGKRLYVVAADGSVAALRAKDGRIAWTRRLSGRASTAPLLERGVLYVGTDDRRIHALDAGTGATRKTVTVTGKPEGRLSISGRLLLLLTKKGDLIALDRGTLQVRWQRVHERSFASEEPHVWRDEVVVADCRGEVKAFALADGTPRWDLRVTGCIRSVNSNDRLLFLGAQEGLVYAVRR